jgi:hypothetical protein
MKATAHSEQVLATASIALTKMDLLLTATRRDFMAGVADITRFSRFFR